ncbi:hypothetical protein NVP1138O_24 [Vibrio phage 1.138.O._10N.261.48.A1]|nr:hypothetical protein NVP1138O_24 [Vibrio phage 1.138.O._10N.261.48.A1]
MDRKLKRFTGVGRSAHVRVFNEMKEQAHYAIELQEKIDKLLSDYGDNWFDGFMAARDLVKSNPSACIEEYSDHSVLEMSEVAEEDYLNRRMEKVEE